MIFKVQVLTVFSGLPTFKILYGTGIEDFTAVMMKIADL